MVINTTTDIFDEVGELPECPKDIIKHLNKELPSIEFCERHKCHYNIICNKKWIAVDKLRHWLLSQKLNPSGDLYFKVDDLIEILNR